MSDDFFFTKFAIYSYNWANYSISLQKSPLSNIITYKNNISRLVHDPPRILCDPHDPQPKVWGSWPPTSRIDAYDLFDAIVFQERHK